MSSTATSAHPTENIDHIHGGFFGVVVAHAKVVRYVVWDSSKASLPLKRVILMAKTERRHARSLEGVLETHTCVGQVSRARIILGVLISSVEPRHCLVRVKPCDDIFLMLCICESLVNAARDSHAKAVSAHHLTTFQVIVLSLLTSAPHGMENYKITPLFGHLAGYHASI